MIGPFPSRRGLRALAVFLLALGCSQAQDTVRINLRWGEGSSADTLIFALNLSNPVAVRGVELNFSPLPGELSLVSVALTPRSQNLNLADSLYPGGYLRVLLTSLAGIELPPGEGDVLTLTCVPHGSIPDCYLFHFGFVMVSGPGTSTYPVIVRDTCLSLQTMAVRDAYPAVNSFFSISPNPGHGEFVLRWKKSWPGEGRFALYDLRGRRIQSPALRLVGRTATGLRFRLQDVPTGLYFWQLQLKKGLYRGKLVVF